MKPDAKMVSGYCTTTGSIYYAPHKLKIYLEKGGDPDAYCGGTPLIHAVALYSKGIEDLELLLQAGAKPNPRNRYCVRRMTTFHVILERCQNNNWFLPWDKIEVLVRYGADLNEPYGDSTEFRPIHDLMSYVLSNVDSGRMVRRLIRLGARIDIPARDGVLPLHLAAAFANPKAAVSLIRAGTPVDVLDKFGRSPLHRAAEHVHHNDERVIELVEALLRHKANINLADKKGETALIKLAKTRVERVGLAEYLMSCGADSSLADKDGMTARHWAIASCNFARVKPKERPMVKMLGGRLKR